MLLKVFNKILKFSKFVISKKLWRKTNNHNFTYMSIQFDPEIVKIGKGTYGGLNVYTWGAKNSFLSIGNYVSIAPGVKFLLDGNHNTETFSTYPFKVFMLNEDTETLGKGEIVVEDDVWIGMDVLVLSGVRVGKGAIIAAGSVVTKNVDPFTIVGGNPARFIKYRFPEELREKMSEIDFSEVNKEFVKKNIDRLYIKLNIDLVDELKKEITDMK